MIKKEYSNGTINIIWQPAKCEHAGVCVRSLPDVYKPKEKPWINADGADSLALVNQINACPSGALSYRMPAENIKEDSEQKKYFVSIGDKEAKIEYIKSSDKIYLTHTEVADTLTGKGIGSKLIKGVLQKIKEENLTLIPLCPFVAMYIKNHPEWKELVLKGVNIK